MKHSVVTGNKAPGRIVVAADIHGATDGACALAERLGAELFSPWPAGVCPYPSEAAAHAAFIADGGIEAYAARLSEALHTTPAFIVGFSVGATAAWLHAASDEAAASSEAWLFYGSRIRLHADLTPKFPVRVVFAEHEAAFSPAELAPRIAGERVCVVVEPNVAHGFMNAHSENFSAGLCEHYIACLERAITRFLLTRIE